MSKSSAPSCVVCCEQYNRSTRLPVKCESSGCEYSACVTCVRAYLLTSTSMPHCMECKYPWSAKFQLILTKKWVNDVYRPHREKLLCDVELSKLPESMDAAENYKNIKKEEAAIAYLRLKEAELRKSICDLYGEIGQKQSLIRTMKNGNGAAVEKKVFVMSCPANECNGMLSTQYKCGICENYTCSSCHEVIGPAKTAEHVCDPNSVASAEAIKKETKQCPGCHKRIFRIEGCSQMWCTGCHTSFDWNTGRKVIGERIHNPHAIEYMRKMNGGGGAMRAPGDVLCGGLPDEHIVKFAIRKIEAAKDIDKERLPPIIYIYRLVSEITRNNIRTLRQQQQLANNTESLRVRYIVGEISHEQFSGHIYRDDKQRQKCMELLHVFELLSAVGIDLFNQIMPLVNEVPIVGQRIVEMLREYDALRVHCNGLFATISNTYSQSVPQVDWNWTLGTARFNSKTMATAGLEEPTA